MQGKKKSVKSGEKPKLQKNEEIIDLSDETTDFSDDDIVELTDTADPESEKDHEVIDLTDIEDGLGDEELIQDPGSTDALKNDGIIRLNKQVMHSDTGMKSDEKPLSIKNLDLTDEDREAINEEIGLDFSDAQYSDTVLLEDLAGGPMSDRLTEEDTAESPPKMMNVIDLSTNDKEIKSIEAFGEDGKLERLEDLAGGPMGNRLTEEDVAENSLKMINVIDLNDENTQKADNPIPDGVNTMDIEYIEDPRASMQEGDENAGDKLEMMESLNISEAFEFESEKNDGPVKPEEITDIGLSGNEEHVSDNDDSEDTVGLGELGGHRLVEELNSEKDLLGGFLDNDSSASENSDIEPKQDADVKFLDGAVELTDVDGETLVDELDSYPEDIKIEMNSNHEPENEMTDQDIAGGESVIQLYDELEDPEIPTGNTENDIRESVTDIHLPDHAADFQETDSRESLLAQTEEIEPEIIEASDLELEDESGGFSEEPDESDMLDDTAELENLSGELSDDSVEEIDPEMLDASEIEEDAEFIEPEMLDTFDTEEGEEEIEPEYLDVSDIEGEEDRVELEMIDTSNIEEDEDEIKSEFVEPRELEIIEEDIDPNAQKYTVDSEESTDEIEIGELGMETGDEAQEPEPLLNMDVLDDATEFEERADEIEGVGIENEVELLEDDSGLDADILDDTIDYIKPEQEFEELSVDTREEMMSETIESEDTRDVSQSSGSDLDLEILDNTFEFTPPEDSDDLIKFGESSDHQTDSDVLDDLNEEVNVETGNQVNFGGDSLDSEIGIELDDQLSIDMPASFEPDPEDKIGEPVFNGAVEDDILDSLGMTIESNFRALEETAVEENNEHPDAGTEDGVFDKEPEQNIMPDEIDQLEDADVGISMTGVETSQTDGPESFSEITESSAMKPEDGDEEKEDVEPSLESIPPGKIESAIEKAVEKIFAQKIDKILVDVIEKAVTSEIGKLKTILSEEMDGEE